ncbi:Eisosome component PIL1-domain-containing protein [Limtongia smithiae]|uniref:Eisosome component PIL1-domain-containing protein n=1 Tax=Limtongia smithiae TaxID=1125753 RepID=UPI0034CECD87
MGPSLSPLRPTYRSDNNTRWADALPPLSTSAYQFLGPSAGSSPNSLTSPFSPYVGTTAYSPSSVSSASFAAAAAAAACRPSATSPGSSAGCNNSSPRRKQTLLPHLLAQTQTPLARLIKSFPPLSAHHRAAALSTHTTARLLSTWGTDTQSSCSSGTTEDPAVADICTKLSTILQELATQENIYANGIDDAGALLRAITELESCVRPARGNQHKLRERIAKAAMKYDERGGRNQRDKLEQLECQLVRADAEVLVADAQLFNLTRQRLAYCCRALLDALEERCNKQLALVRSGRGILRFLEDGDTLLPGQTVREYTGHSKTRQILAELQDELFAWNRNGGQPRGSRHRGNENEGEEEEEELEEEELVEDDDDGARVHFDDSTLKPPRRGDL